MLAEAPPPPPMTCMVMPGDEAVVTAGPHRIRPGDTLGGIALRYQVSQGDLREVNDLSNGSTIRVGDHLVIPTRPWQPPTGSAGGQSTAGLPASRGATRLTAAQQRVRAEIESVAGEYDVDPDLALAVGWQESRWRQDGIVSDKGARGAMQCMPTSGEWMSDRAGRELDIDDLHDNVTCGVLLLKTLGEQTPREDEVLAGYYQGMASMRGRGTYQDSFRYIAEVQQHRERIAAGELPRD